MEKVEKRKNRSDAYQFLILETCCSHEMMEGFSNNDSMEYRLNPWAYNEELLDLQDELKIEFWRIINTMLTARQKEVITLYADGYTQMEIAKMLNVNQSSITKSINGNVDYKKNKKTQYGGSLQRIKKIVEKDSKIKDILNKIQKLREEKF